MGSCVSSCAKSDTKINDNVTKFHSTTVKELKSHTPETLHNKDVPMNKQKFPHVPLKANLKQSYDEGNAKVAAGTLKNQNMYVIPDVVEAGVIKMLGNYSSEYIINVLNGIEIYNFPPGCKLTFKIDPA